MSGSYYSRNRLMDDWEADETAAAIAAHERAVLEANDYVRDLPQTPECGDLWQRCYDEYLADHEFSEDTSYWHDRLKAEARGVAA